MCFQAVKMKNMQYDVFIKIANTRKNFTCRVRPVSAEYFLCCVCHLNNKSTYIIGDMVFTTDADNPIDQSEHKAITRGLLVLF